VIEHSVETLVLPPEARSPAQSRRFVARALANWGMQALVDPAVLLTSELVTNAVVHAQTDVVVTIRREDRECITISVYDGSLRPPRIAPHSDDAATGRGLGILDTLASSWEVQTVGSAGKTVSFSLRGPGVPKARRPRG